MAISLRRVEERPLSLWEEGPLSLWREGGLFSDFERRMDRVFGDILGGPLVNFASSDSRGVFSPRIDIRETDKNVVIAAEMPGIDQKEIDVSIHNGILTISGEKKVEKDEGDLDYHHVERSYGCFSRSISLPDYVNADKLEATYKNGILTITLPKDEKAMKHVKKIPVKAA